MPYRLFLRSLEALGEKPGANAPTSGPGAVHGGPTAYSGALDYSQSEVDAMLARHQARREKAAQT